MKYYNEGDTVSVIDPESGSRYDVLALVVTATYIEGPYSHNGNTFDSGRFAYSAYTFPHEKLDPIDILRRLVEMQGEQLDLSQEETEVWSEAKAIVARHDLKLQTAAA